MKTDMEIQQDVIDELRWQPELNASEIGVAVKSGIVTLSGTVDSFAKKKAAENAVRGVAGVKAVAEDIEVRLSPHGKRNDTEIAQAVLNALKWNSGISENKVKVKVENGWVFFDGRVDWEYEKSIAGSLVEDLEGVTGVTNSISVKPKAGVDDIRKRISDAFHRSATVDADHIALSVVGSKAILDGKVRSYAERKDAESATWRAPGIEKVDNRLEVDSTAFDL